MKQEIELQIIRTHANGTTLIGNLTCCNREMGIKFYTLENKEKAIPCGDYTISCTHSPRFNTLLWQINGVESRRGIRFHSANHSNQLKGCIALGLKRKKDSIFYSGLAMQLFHETLNSGKEYKLTIKEIL